MQSNLIFGIYFGIFASVAELLAQNFRSRYMNRPFLICRVEWRADCESGRYIVSARKPGPIHGPFKPGPIDEELPSPGSTHGTIKPGPIN